MKILYQVSWFIRKKKNSMRKRYKKTSILLLQDTQSCKDVAVSFCNIKLKPP
jgi:hypothetical protein